MENTAQAEEKQAVNYDANATQRFAFTIKKDGEKYDTAHILKPLSGERYLSYLKSIEIKDDTTEVLEAVKKAGAELWNDLNVEVEEFELEAGEELKDAIESDEKNEVINNFLAVAIVESEKAATGKRTSKRSDAQTVTTEAFYNGVPIKQVHVLQAASGEWKRKFDRIYSKRFKPEETKGLSRKPKFVYVPQDEKFGGLYDEMLISNEGFANDITPLRFKTAVIIQIFTPKFDEKK